MKSLPKIFFFSLIGMTPFLGQSTNDGPTVTLMEPTGTPTLTLPPDNVVTTTNAIPLTTAPVLSGQVATLDPSDLVEFKDQPPSVQKLILNGLALTKKNLKYMYGSDDPKNGGMDCSGTVYYLLIQSGYKDVPRDASELYEWTWKQGHFQAVVSNHSDTFELNQLQPGDLLFWTGTYKIDRDPPVTHVMIYLGTNRQTGHRVMLGASEGRQFDGKSRYGVSVFDFILSGKASDPASSSRFIGYSPIPHLRDTPVTSSNPSTTSAASNPLTTPLSKG